MATFSTLHQTPGFAFRSHNPGVALFIGNRRLLVSQHRGPLGEWIMEADVP